MFPTSPMNNDCVVRKHGIVLGQKRIAVIKQDSAGNTSPSVLEASLLRRSLSSAKSSTTQFQTCPLL
eukprot:9843400-Prorocentrum_lima.AAC.1